MTAVDSQDQIWVEQDNYHTAIVMYRDLVIRFAPELVPALGTNILVRFGWGDRDYFGSSSKNTYKMLKALFLPTRSVVEVSGFDQLSKAGAIIVSISQSNLQLNAMIEFIRQSFYLKSKGPQLLRTESTGCRYYRGRGLYFAGKNCNNWTAKALNIAGLNVRYRFAFFADSVMKQIV